MSAPSSPTAPLPRLPAHPSEPAGFAQVVVQVTSRPRLPSSRAAPLTRPVPPRSTTFCTRVCVKAFELRWARVEDLSAPADAAPPESKQDAPGADGRAGALRGKAGSIDGGIGGSTSPERASEERAAEDGGTAAAGEKPATSHPAAEEEDEEEEEPGSADTLASRTLLAAAARLEGMLERGEVRAAWEASTPPTEPASEIAAHGSRGQQAGDEGRDERRSPTSQLKRVATKHARRISDSLRRISGGWGGRVGSAALPAARWVTDCAVQS
ncbi:hypothetical protein DFJ74DRAFT_731391 [Hyaloraphidium curvatum]|nr:hypothetical protein DFJ74DRAFT_731391 [Hyaloraphidium curvatum]